MLITCKTFFVQYNVMNYNEFEKNISATVTVISDAIIEGSMPKNSTTPV